ncbi:MULTISPECIES: ABC transporter substrate-binding protein [Exiguobacterium]|uniref:ABC transporter substrate-binding protein n=1 Tax=Exiguobacterium TaxID=33986 RepID=UPI001BE8BFB4|nr:MULTISPECIES: extracellular solute-binding protein [Exiguobacterium]MCT4781638.1 extracellular solute-binding protein [Exiguobacterium himgiriensis]
MSKKSRYSFLAAGFVLATLAGCTPGGSGGDSGKTEIKFINGFTGGDGDYMTKIVNDFNESQDEYTIVQSQEKEHYTKFKSGDYHLVVMHETNLETYQKDQLIQEAGPFMEAAGISEDDFNEAGIQSGLIEEQMFGVPLDIHPLTMFYNEELVQEAPTDYEQLKQLGETLQSENSNLYAFGLPSTGLTTFYFTVAAAQNNIDLAKEGYLNFTDDAYADALMQYHSMIFEDNVSPEKLGLDGEFQAFMKSADDGAKQTAVTMTGPWYYQAVKEKYGDSLGIGKMPTLFETPATTGNAHTIAVAASVDDDAIKDGIAEFLTFMYTPENLANWAESGQTVTHLETLDYISEDPEKYDLANVNQEQLEMYTPAPRVYQFDEQMRYMNEVVFTKLTNEPNLTKEDLMKELEKATKASKQVADTQPE